MQRAWQHLHRYQLELPRAEQFEIKVTRFKCYEKLSEVIFTSSWRWLSTTLCPKVIAVHRSSRLREGVIGVEFNEASEGPHREDRLVVVVVNRARLVEHAHDVLLSIKHSLSYRHTSCSVNHSLSYRRMTCSVNQTLAERQAHNVFSCQSNTCWATGTRLVLLSIIRWATGTRLVLLSIIRGTTGMQLVILSITHLNYSAWLVLMSIKHPLTYRLTEFLSACC